MPIENDPVVAQWYRHLDKGYRFQITSVDQIEGTVDIQHFDGDVEELDLDDWYGLEIERQLAVLLRPVEYRRRLAFRVRGPDLGCMVWLDHRFSLALSGLLCICEFIRAKPAGGGIDLTQIVE